MRLLCCCLCGPAGDDELAAAGENRCSCLRDCVQGILDKYRSMFERRRVSATDHEAVPLDSEMAHNGSTAPIHSDQTLPVASNPRYSPVSRDDHVVGGQDSQSSRLTVQSSVKECKMEGKLVNAYSQVGSKERGSVSSLKVPSLVMLNGVEYFIPSSEDEDVCPTCLEEYNEENPKITTYCSHHFHLGCIYEWMERSETCPVCGKLMEFDE